MNKANSRWFGLCALAAVGAAVGAHADCDVSTLNGRYSAMNQGTIFDDRMLIGAVATATFDGKSQWSINNPWYITQGRGAAPGPDLKGTYTVNSDCLGTTFVDDGSGQKFQFVIASGGNEVFALVEPGPAQINRVVHWLFKKQ